MLDKLRHTVKHTAVYSLGNLSTKLIGLVLLPLYLEKLNTAEYGILAILEVTSQFIIAVFGMRLSVAMMRWYAVENDVKEKGRIIFTTFFTTLVILVIINLLLQPFTKDLSILFFETPDFRSYFVILIIWSTLEMLNRLGLDLLRLKERSGSFILATLFKFLLVLVLNFYFILHLEMGVKGIILSQMIGSGVLTLFFIPFLLHQSIPGFSFPVLKGMLRYSVP
ncbi:MAG: oligosaccharide flippase family protein, partial [Bacteroidales bacterium]|nr:oligosaccharide flippase family protein [Bacteroidales bacterium]